MSEEKKYVTFRDLRAVTPSPKSASETSSSTSISSTPSTTSITEIPTDKLESDSTPSTSSSTSTPSTSSTTSISPTGSRLRARQNQRTLSVAPESDFQRVPNSVTRRAIPEGL